MASSLVPTTDMTKPESLSNFLGAFGPDMPCGTPAITARHPAAPRWAQQLRAALHDSLQAARSGQLVLHTPSSCAVGQRAAGHFHLGAELFVQLGGYTDFHFPHAQFRLLRGQALVVPPKLLHAERAGADADTAFSNLVLNADAQLITCHLAHEAPAGRPAALYLEVCQHPDSALVQGWLAALARAPAHDPQQLWPLQQQGLLVAVLSAVARLLDTPTAQPQSTDALLQQLHVLVRDRLGDPQLSVAQLAQALGCSPDTLTQRYRAHSGNALWSDVVRLRLERAAQLLRDEPLAVKEVAWCCGFASPSHFVQRFGQHYGCSPARWRAQHSTPTPAP